MFYDLLQIRASSTLWRLSSAGEVKKLLRLFNTGRDQEGAVVEPPRTALICVLE